MPNSDSFQFQQLDFEGLKTLISWAIAEGWNAGSHDAEAFWAADPDGFYGYYFEDELIAGGSVVSYGGAFGFMGLFIVHPDYRAAGIGRQIWYQRREKLLSRLKPDASIGMDGVVAMQPFYQKGGFEIAFRDERHEKIGETFPIDAQISSILPEDYPAILAIDTRCFGFPRPDFMQTWLTLPERQPFKFQADGKVKGFAVLRKVQKGHKIGPLFAESPEIAEALYKACLNAAIGESVFLDIPMANTAAIEMVQRFGTTYVFECARMYHGPVPAIPIHQVFGITTFELG